MNAIVENLDVFWNGFLATLGLVALAGIMSAAAGVLLASFSISPVPLLRRISSVYVALMRNIPAAAHLFFTIFILPLLGLKFDFFTLALIGITIYFAAYYCEAIRAGINAIGAGQFEAARAMGLKKAQTFRLIVLPQGMRNSVPPLINTTIALVKVTAIAGVYGVTELFGAMLQLINTNDSAVIVLMLFTAVLYSAITIPAALAAAALERRVVFSS
ncbi:amino acid ABC transporter permease [Pseudarthrobacter sp. DSP2-3-2b1]|uniref:amino acid ABC transporter permease n=1 Tax=Pseudarthrobacter sp. DSP2-3-2b1 TaxID=2804661 RepID=UPI003CE7103F